MWLIAVSAALLLWLGLLLWPPQAHRTRERLTVSDGVAELGDVTVLIPARNEAALIGRTLAGLARQGPGLEIILVDDASEDRTAERARAAAAALAQGTPGHVPFAQFRVLESGALPAGWTGKLWALEQGLRQVRRPYTLLLDADIELGPGTIAALRERSRVCDLQLVSVMATLRCRTFWERLLAPPFVFFFKLIYPFARVNDPSSRVAAAAGGCMLVETAALRAIGGFAAIRGQLIDDCALAAALKRNGGRLWLGLSHAVRSLRPYPSLHAFWDMVTRTAFCQLRYSIGWLVLASALMLLAFAVPVLGCLAGDSIGARLAAVGGLIGMCVAYAPVSRFYRQGLLWTVSLPLAAALYLVMTWGSAWRYWRGVRATWKNRHYESTN